MWNMTDADRKYYKRQEISEARRMNTLEKARNRAKVLVEYLEENGLESSSQMELSEFHKLMKKANNDFDSLV